MSFFIRAVRGEYDLSVTYWGIGVVGTILIRVLSFCLIYAANQQVMNPTIYDVIFFANNTLVVSYTLFACIAIINSAGKGGARTFWGWAATIIAVIGIVRTLYSVLMIFGVISTGWGQFAAGIERENIGLPVELEKGLILSRMSVNKANYSLIYLFDFDINTLNSSRFNLDLAKEAVLEDCSELTKFLNNPVKIIIFRYAANDGSTADIEIYPQDCGLEP